MKCAYCDSLISPYPADGICPNCGAKLPPPPPQPQRPAYRVPLQPGINCCSRCMDQRITCKRRGFSWGWGILGFFLIPFFGIFLGFCGASKQIFTCQSCGHTWKR